VAKKDRVGLVSLGCPKNRVDSEIMLGLLQADGYQLTDNPAEAECLIINTCGFIGDAKKESIDTILEYANYKTEGNCRALIVTGCLAQRYNGELATEIPEIDALVGTGTFPAITQIVREALTGSRAMYVGSPELPRTDNLPRLLSTPPYTAYLKIAEGCGHNCSFCVIPSLRGRLRSRTREAIFSEAAQLAARGVKELILIAQDTTQYGIDIYGRPALAELLAELAVIEGLVWIRLLYTYPANFTDELIAVIKREPKICRYLDLPLQHISDRVLRKMNRRGGKQEISELIEKIRREIPEVALRSSFIVGFPGETKEEFAELLSFLRDSRFERVGVFPYSREEGTPAAAIAGQVAEKEKKWRYRRAMTVQQEISRSLNEALVGQTMTILVEGETGRSDYSFYGRTYRDAPQIDGIAYLAGTGLQPGTFIRTVITGADTYDLYGRPI
jgi:ribosomal protein S12 methylthiotransferase